MAILDLMSRIIRKLGPMPGGDNPGSVWKTRNVRLLGPRNTVISEPGTYWLDEDLHAPISITASSVVVDMNGRTLIGKCDPDTTTTAISIAAGVSDITIRGGTVRGHHYGLRADSVVRLTIQGMTFGQQTFRGIRADGTEIVVTDCRFFDVGGTSLYSDSYAMAIEVNGTCRIEENIVRDVFPTDSGEGIGILVGYNSEKSSVTSNLVTYSHQPNSGRTFGIWSASDRVSIQNNVVDGATYAIEGSGATANLRIDSACTSYKGLPHNDRSALTGQPIVCPDDYQVAMHAVRIDDRNSLFRAAQVHHLAGMSLLSFAYFRLAAKAGSAEAQDEANRLIAANLLSSHDVQAGDALVAILEAYYARKQQTHKDRSNDSAT